jgi:hypothetical protein
VTDKISSYLAVIQLAKGTSHKLTTRNLGVNSVGFYADANFSDKVNYCVHGFALGTCPSGCQQ